MTLLRLTFACAALTLLVVAGPAHADHGSNDDASPNMLHVANLPPPPQFLVGPANETRVNSDFAFHRAGKTHSRFHDLLAQGNYDGFRLVDISDPSNPVQVSVFECRANQGDLSFYEAKDRLLLIQSIDVPQTSEDCATARDQPVARGVHPITGLPGNFFVPGFEGLRIFDVTNPEAPVHIASVPTACGSHTHTTIPDERNRQGVVYVSSYPTGASVTPGNVDFGGARCVPPHERISIVIIPDDSPATPIVKEQPLHADTLPFRGTLGSGGTGAIGCHDITAFRETRSANPAQNARESYQVAGAACLEEGQLWDITDPENPTTLGQHSHIRNPFISTQNGLFHTASMSTDGEVVLFTDEFAGGGGSGCKGPADTRGNVWFYKNVPPGTEPVPLYGRYMVPRSPAPVPEICSLHNGNVITVSDEADGDFGVSSLYQGGTTVFDFTGADENPEIVLPATTLPATVPPLVAREVAFFDAKNDPPPPTGLDDVWSSYWYNDFVYASSGRVQAGRPGNRGLDVYMLVGRNGRLVDRATRLPTVTTQQEANRPNVQQFKGRKVRYMNPQTQDVFHNVSHGR